MPLPVPPFLRSAALLPLLLVNVLGAPPFSVTTHMVREGAPSGGRWTIPRAAAFGAELLMTLSKLSTTGTDVYQDWPSPRAAMAASLIPPKGYATPSEQMKRHSSSWLEESSKIDCNTYA